MLYCSSLERLYAYKIIRLYGGRVTDMRRDKSNLIPFERLRKVIYLKKRAKSEQGIPVSAVIFWILGVCCILYCGGIAVAGFGTYFFLIWGAMGIVFLLLGTLLSNRALVSRVPRWLKVTTLSLFFLGILLFVGVEGLILSQYRAVPEPGADYVIILGAQWRQEGPSEVLRRRLDRAVEYLNENPDTQVIVSGGQGSNEPVSEAAGMRQYLVDVGINDERIQMEDASTNTFQNLIFSGRLLDPENDKVVIVTNNFHVFRAVCIAEKQGYRDVEGMAAGSVAGMAPHNLLREFFGVVKDFLEGNL